SSDASSPRSPSTSAPSRRCTRKKSSRRSRPSRPPRTVRLPLPGAPATLELPLLPLKNVVLFPHMIVPLYVGRERSINALDQAMAGGKQIFLCTQRRADCEEPQEADLYRVGVLAQVVQMLRLPDGTIKVLIEGSTRAVIERFIAVEAHLAVEVATLEEDVEPSKELEALMRGVVGLFDRYVELDK